MSLSDRLSQLMEARGFSQSSLAREIGVTQQTIGKLTRGESRNSVHLHHIARALGTSVEYLVGETDEVGAIRLREDRTEYEPPARQGDSDLVEVAEIDLRFGLGGAFMDELPEPEIRSFSRAWLRQITTSPASELYWARGQGNSMEPTIGDGDILLIDRTQQTPAFGDLYWAIAFGQVGMIKRLRPMPDGSVKILSDNPSVPPETAVDEELHIFGRVIAVVRKI